VGEEFEEHYFTITNLINLNGTTLTWLFQLGKVFTFPSTV
jgi:hypothetical protein